MSAITNLLKAGEAETRRILGEEYLLPWDIIEFARDMSTNGGETLAYIGERCQVVEVTKLPENQRHIIARTATGTRLQFVYPSDGVVPVRLWRAKKELPHQDWYRLKSATQGEGVEY